MKSFIYLFIYFAGAGLGCLTIGFCLEHFEGHTTFFYVSVLCAISATINILSTLLLTYRKGSQGDAKLSASVELN